MKLKVCLFALLSAVQLSAQDFVAGPYLGYGIAGPIVGDFNGDSNPDVLGIQYLSGLDKVVLQTGNGATPITFTEKNLNISQDITGGPAVADLDGDTDLDIVLSTGNNNALTAFLNDGAGNFTQQNLSGNGSNLLKIADVDHDGDQDIVGINTGNGTLILYVNNGSLNFSQTNIFSGASNLYALDLADLDNDNDQDIVLGYRQFSGKQITFHRNMGANNYPEIIVASDNFSSLEALQTVDINNDGKKDIVAARTFNCSAFVNQGNLTFASTSLASASIIRSFAAGDFNGDSKMDLVIGTNSNGVTWHKNLSNATLEFATADVSGLAPAYTITTGDLDKDGDTDIVASNGEFWWFENQIIQEPSATQFVPASSVRVYPNPVNDVLYFENPDSDACTLELINLQGEIVLRTESTNNNIPMRQVQPGVYKVRIINHQKQSAGCSTVIKI